MLSEGGRNGNGSSLHRAAPQTYPGEHSSSPEERLVVHLASISNLLRGQKEDILDDSLKTILQLTLEGVDATSGSILALDAHGNIQQAYLAHLDQIQPLSTERTVALVDQGLAGWIVKKRKPALVSSTLEDPRWLRQGWELHENATRSAIGIPLLAEEQVVGALILARPEEKHFTKDELAHLLEIVKQ